MHLVLAVITARENDRTKTRDHIDTARQIARRLGQDRNDFDTEFGPTNVELYAISVAVDLGDAGEALETATDLDITGLSPERQTHYHLDLAAPTPNADTSATPSPPSKPQNNSAPNKPAPTNSPEARSATSSDSQDADPPTNSKN